MKRKKTTLTLKEAHIGADSGATFQELFQRVGSELPTVVSRVHKVDLYTKLVIAEVSNEDELTFARLVELEEGAAGLLNLETENASAQIEALPAPAQRKFVRSEAFVLIGGNHVITVGWKNKGGTFIRAMLDLAERCGINDDYDQTVLVDVANEAEVARIRELGVKSVEFYITGYLADLDPKAISGVDSGLIRRMFKRPMSRDERRKSSNARGRVVLSRGDIRSQEIETDLWLDEVAVAAFKETEGYRIVLGNDEELKGEKLKVATTQSLRTHATSLDAQETKLAMKEYWKVLQGRGLLPR